MTRGTGQTFKRLLNLSMFLAVLIDARAFAEPAYTVHGKTFSVSDAAKKDPSAFFELEKRKYDLIEEMAREEYLKKHWEDLAATQKKSVEDAKSAFLKSKIQVQDKDVETVLTQFKDHPQLSKLPKAEQMQQVREYLESREAQKVMEDILTEAFRTKKIQILLSKPQEPVFDIPIAAHEPVLYGPKSTDTKPTGCKDDACPITIVEYSEFMCPFCKKMLSDTTKVLETYKGKIRWITRDFPLEQIHPEARPAAIAAKCAHFQGKFWQMYTSIFDDQKNLSDASLIKRAEKIPQLDMKKFSECFKQPAKVAADSPWKRANDLVTENLESGKKYGVNGTPAFFINGRKLSGALPFAEFQRIIEEELTKKKT